MIGAVPDHEPEDALNDCPSCADPETSGGTVFTGALGGPVPAVYVTTSCGSGNVA